MYATKMPYSLKMLQINWEMKTNVLLKGYNFQLSQHESDSMCQCFLEMGLTVFQH